MKTYNVAILGATGAVGREMYKVLMERKFPIGQFKLLASARSAGKVLNGHTPLFTICSFTSFSD